MWSGASPNVSAPRVECSCVTTLSAAIAREIVPARSKKQDCVNF
jgi:hypothetical protein